MDTSKYDLEIKHHVFIQAMKRGIHPDFIEDTLTKGRMERFGKNGVKNFKGNFTVKNGIMSLVDNGQRTLTKHFRNFIVPDIF